MVTQGELRLGSRGESIGVGGGRRRSLAVLATGVARDEYLPRAARKIELASLRLQRFVAEQDEGVRGRAAACNMTMVVHITGRSQGDDVPATQCVLFCQPQFRSAIVMAQHVPALMCFHSADGRNRDPALVRVSRRHDSLRPVKQQQPWPAGRPDQPLARRPPGRQIHDQGSKELLVGSQVDQKPADGAHISPAAGGGIR